MASAVRRSHTSKWKDYRRGSVGSRVAVYGGFILCICFLLTVYELLRYGYLSSTGVQQKQEVHRIETAGEEQRLVQSEHYNRSSIYQRVESVGDSIDKSDFSTIAGTSGEGVKDDDDSKDKQDIEVSQDDTEKGSNQETSGTNSHGEQTVARRDFGKEFRYSQRDDNDGDVSRLQVVGEISKEEVEVHGLITSSKDDVTSPQSPRLGSGKDGGLWDGWTAWFSTEENSLQEHANDISPEGSTKETNSSLASIYNEDREAPDRDDEDRRNSLVDDTEISELPVLDQTAYGALLDGGAPIVGNPQGLQRFFKQDSGHQSSSDPPTPIEVRLTPDMDRAASIDDKDLETPDRDDEDRRNSLVDDTEISELPQLNKTSDGALLDGGVPIVGSPQGLQRFVEEESGHQSSAHPSIEVRLTSDMDRAASIDDKDREIPDRDDEDRRNSLVDDTEISELPVLNKSSDGALLDGGAPIVGSPQGLQRFVEEESGLQSSADPSIEVRVTSDMDRAASIDDKDLEIPDRDDEDKRNSLVDNTEISELPVLNKTSDGALLDGGAPIVGSPQGLQRFVEESGHQSSPDPPIEVKLTPDIDQFAERGEQGQANTSVGLAMNEKEIKKVELPSENESDWNLPRVIVKKWKPPNHCGTAEEMGSVAVGDTRAASLRVRSMIQKYILEHGAERVRSLPAEEFCNRGFSLGQAQEDGFGNNMYKVLTGAGLAIMLNRSLIIGERGALNPAYTGGQQVNRPAFGDYLEFSNQSFTMREVKRLWAVHGCNKKYYRPLVMHVDNLEKGLGHSSCLCDDWTTLPYPIIHFKGATNTAALQFLLKNAHPAMRSAAAKLLGNPSIPSSRPNTFGELFRAFISPNADIQEAVEWALKGGLEPDVSLHLRMLHSRSKPAPASASSCVRRIIEDIRQQQIGRRRPHVVVVTDTPAVNSELQRALGQSVEVIRFNYLAFLKASSNLSEVISLHHGEPPRKRVKDWGGMPRWVAMVDFFLAARARLAVVSGAYRRVSTTYAQLVASLAAAYTLEENGSPNSTFAYYSSFQPALVSSGLSGQSGWGHTWRPFGGRLGCRKQAAQCARTPLLPYAWWDAPWQSPISADIRKLQGVANIDAAGQVSERHLEKFCSIAKRRPLMLVTLAIPVCSEEKPCS